MPARGLRLAIGTGVPTEMAETDWNFADVWEQVSRILPDMDVLVHGTRRQSWAETNRRANGLAAALLEAGLGRQDKVAQYLYNCPEYLESVFASFKAGLVPVNTNYRYGRDELVYLWTNSDTKAVVFHASFAEMVSGLRSEVPEVRAWVWVDDGSGPCPPWAVPYEEAAGRGAHEDVRGPWGRSGDDLYLLYTGGTTGYPKGVMWRQDDLFAALNSASLLPYPEDQGLDGIRRTLTGPTGAHLPACPLMHGTGAFTSFSALDTGASVVTLTRRSFDPVELLDTVERERVTSIAIVGDAFAKPILRELDAHPGRWDISSVTMIISSGVMWSQATKEGLHRHNPNMVLVDAFSSSEALGMGVSVSTAGSEQATARFSLGENARVVTEDGRDVAPGSGQVGLLAVGGRNPLGYYKDEAKTSQTFKVIGGRRYSVPGDWATVEADGSIRLLGRGSVCINTGGEKVFPEEVEEAIKANPKVADAAAVGIPDERFGEAVCAVVQPADGAQLDPAEVVEGVRARLAGYKAPKHVVVVDNLGRAPNGKLDYGELRRRALQALAATSS
jgi:acyl-CoA synthetase (AMP-forming)/AMP-acid ligase II